MAHSKSSWVANRPFCLVRPSCWDDWTLAIPIYFERAQRSVYPPLILRNAQNKNPASVIDAGSVSTQAINRLRTVPHCRPE